VDNHILRIIFFYFKVYMVINQYHDNDNNTTITFDFIGNSATRGNRYKLRYGCCKYDLRRHFFTNRIVAILNSLPDFVVDAHRVNVSKILFVCCLTAHQHYLGH